MSAPSHITSRPLLEALTGLRFVAAMAVVLYHIPLPPSVGRGLITLASRGYLGVSLFFVLSGFILTYTYIDPATGSLRGSVRAFWWARVARIYPVYLTALLFSLPIFVVFRLVMAAPATRPGVLLSAIMTPLLLQAWWPSAATQWNTPGWSLSVEVFFYALFPIGAVWLARRRSALVLGLLVWASCLIPPVVYRAMLPDGTATPPSFDRYFWLQAIKFNPVSHLGELALGVAAGLGYLRRGPASIISSRAFAWCVPIGVTAAMIVLVATDWLPYALCHNGLLAPVWAAVILRLAMGKGAVSRLLASRPAVRLGEASYALYLLHSPLLGYLQLTRGYFRLRQPGLTVPYWMQVAAFLVVAIGLSLFLFRRVEEPARRRMRAWMLEATQYRRGDVDRPDGRTVPA